eukprot:10487182-Heterocapsa_arctica.AAC.1
MVGGVGHHVDPQEEPDGGANVHPVLRESARSGGLRHGLGRVAEERQDDDTNCAASGQGCLPWQHHRNQPARHLHKS